MQHAKQGEVFLRLKPVLDIIRAAIWTGRLSDEHPVSVLLVAKQESAKTELLKFFAGTKTIKYFSDITSRGIGKYQKEIEDGRLRHLVLTDLIRVVAHKSSVSERTLQVLASLMAEGESDVEDAGPSQKWSGFPHAGVLTSITPAIFHKRRGKWRETGFMTRFVPVCYAYSRETVHKVHEAIQKGHKLPKPEAEKLPDFPVQIELKQSHAKVLAVRAETLGAQMQTHGFRYHRVLRALAKSSARLNRRGAVSNADVDQVISWSSFFTLQEIIL